MPTPYEPYDGPIISRQEAKELGINKWFTGKPCKHGHLSQRLVTSQACCECRKYVKKKPEPIERVRARAATWREANREKTRDYIREYMRKNWGKYAPKQKIWKEENKHKLRAYIAASQGRRRAALMDAGGTYTPADIQRIGKAQKWKCAYCGVGVKGNYNIDHIVAIAKGGSNWPSNLQLTCPTCNSRKHAKDPMDFARECGKLL